MTLQGRKESFRPERLVCSPFQPKRSSVQIHTLWSESLQPRIEARPFGVPPKRTVLKVQRKTIDRVELLTEISKTENKFFIVVFKRFVKKKKKSPGRGGHSALESYGGTIDPTNLFDDIYVKDIQSLQAIQLLKRYDNDLDRFINSAYKYNRRFEKVDFTPLQWTSLDSDWQ